MFDLNLFQDCNDLSPRNKFQARKNKNFFLKANQNFWTQTSFFSRSNETPKNMACFSSQINTKNLFFLTKILETKTIFLKIKMYISNSLNFIKFPLTQVNISQKKYYARSVSKWSSSSFDALKLQVGLYYFDTL